MISSDTSDVIILGSGVAGLAAALAAHELGLRPLGSRKGQQAGRRHGQFVWADLGWPESSGTGRRLQRGTKSWPLCGFSIAAVATTRECLRSSAFTGGSKVL